MKFDVDELLNQYRAVTATMTEEKYQYLKDNEWISPVNVVRLAMLKKHGATDELLKRAEYAYLFESYANHFYKWWKDNEWGDRENESLSEFAEGALVQAIMEGNEKKVGMSRQQIFFFYAIISVMVII